MHVNKLLAGFGALFSRPHYLAQCTQYAEIQAVTDFFLAKVASNTLHWRSMVLAHAWFALLAPITADLQMAKQVVCLQLENVCADMLLIKVRRPHTF
jgi:hypothetical protein